MNASELSRVIETVGKDRGIKKEIIISALEQAVQRTQRGRSQTSRRDCSYGHRRPRPTVATVASKSPCREQRQGRQGDVADGGEDAMHCVPSG